MKKEWKNIQTSVFQNHFSETNWKRSKEEKAAVTFSMKGSGPPPPFFWTYECELACVVLTAQHTWKYG